MADCGAAGSALDRATASLVASSSADQHPAARAAKAIGSALGGASVTVAPPGGVLLPAAPPERLVLPGARHVGPDATVPAAAMDGAWRAAPRLPHDRGAPVRHPQHFHPAQHGHPPQHLMAAQHHHQQQQMQMMAMQQQMMAMQMAQAQQIGAIHAKAQARQKNEASRAREADSRPAASPRPQEQRAGDAAASDFADAWHDGLEEDARAELRGYQSGQGTAVDDAVSVTGEGAVEEDPGTIGHEGLVEGATIEELAAAWAEAEADYAANMGAAYADPDTFDAAGVGEIHPYEFSTESAIYEPRDVEREQDGRASHDSDLMAEGMRHFRAGNTREAILSFERHLRHVDPDSADAWRMLGKCHAENDEDRKAIACLDRAVERDPYDPESLLALGVSSVNELDHAGALRNLRAWITHNPKYAGLDVTPAEEDPYSGEGAVAEEGETSFGHDTREFEDVQRLLVRALEHDPTDAADVREALGVVYNVSRNYEAAADSLRRALDARPGDHSLWNKLGATLANGGHSDEALPAYHRALELKPRYARAWLNMAISQSNLHNYDEAARCYLQTLSLNPDAVHCWSYLRIALTCTERWDLLPLASAQNLEGFREHFDFELNMT